MTESASSVASEEVPNQTPEEVEEIKAQLLEFLGKVFVKDVLDTHEYFKDKMLEKQGVPFDLLSESPEVVQITANKDLVRKAVYVCKNCYLDKDLAVRPWVKPEANTLILRDMSSEIPQEQIEAIFNPNSEENKGNAEMKNCPPVASLRADDLNCWFITFLSEVDCKTALMCLRNVQFEGKRLSVRLKTTANKPIYTGFALGGGAGGSPTAGYSAGSPPVGYGAFNSPTLPPPGQGQEGLGGWENSNSGGMGMGMPTMFFPPGYAPPAYVGGMQYPGMNGMMPAGGVMHAGISPQQQQMMMHQQMWQQQQQQHSGQGGMMMQMNPMMGAHGQGQGGIAYHTNSPKSSQRSNNGRAFKNQGAGGRGGRGSGRGEGDSRYQQGQGDPTQGGQGAGGRGPRARNQNPERGGKGGAGGAQLQGQGQGQGQNFPPNAVPGPFVMMPQGMMPVVPSGGGLVMQSLPTDALGLGVPVAAFGTLQGENGIVDSATGNVITNTNASSTGIGVGASNNNKGVRKEAKEGAEGERKTTPKARSSQGDSSAKSEAGSDASKAKRLAQRSPKEGGDKKAGHPSKDGGKKGGQARKDKEGGKEKKAAVDFNITDADFPSTLPTVASAVAVEGSVASKENATPSAPAVAWAAMARKSVNAAGVGSSEPGNGAPATAAGNESNKKENGQKGATTTATASAVGEKKSPVQKNQQQQQANNKSTVGEITFGSFGKPPGNAATAPEVASAGTQTVYKESVKKERSGSSVSDQGTNTSPKNKTKSSNSNKDKSSDVDVTSSTSSTSNGNGHHNQAAPTATVVSGSSGTGSSTDASASADSATANNNKGINVSGRTATSGSASAGVNTVESETKEAPAESSGAGGGSWADRMKMQTRA